MITQQDLDLIGPRPPRRRRARGAPGPGEPPDGPDEPPDAAAPGACARGTAGGAPAPSAGAATPVSVAAVLTISGPCTPPVLDELRARASALFAAGARELVVDLSAVTAADPRLLRVLSRLQRGLECRHARLTLTGAPDALEALLETATLAQAFVIYRCLPQPCPEPAAAGPVDPGLLAAGTAAS